MLNFFQSILKQLKRIILLNVSTLCTNLSPDGS